MIRVLEIRPNGTAVVSTDGLRRVVINPSNEIAGEMLEPFEAVAFVSGFNGQRCQDGRPWAESIDYSEALRREA